MKLTKAVAGRLKTLLEKRKLTQYALSKISGVPQSTISTILSADVQTIKLSTLNDICLGLGVTLSEFFKDDSFNPKNVEED